MAGTLAGSVVVRPRRCETQSRAVLGCSPLPVRLHQFIARLHAHPVAGSAQIDFLHASTMFADTPALPVSRRDSVPCSQPRRAVVSVTF